MKYPNKDIEVVAMDDNGNYYIAWYKDNNWWTWDNSDMTLTGILKIDNIVKWGNIPVLDNAVKCKYRGS